MKPLLKMNRILKLKFILAVYFLVVGAILKPAIAETQTPFLYKGRIFCIAGLNSDGKNELIASLAEKTGIAFWTTTGLNFTSLFEEITDQKIDVRDFAVGDLDNDGDVEIAAISKYHLYVFENVDNEFFLDDSKTTPLYGEERIGKRSIVMAVEEYVNYQTARTDLGRERPGRFPFEKLAGQRIKICDITNDGNQEIVITKLNPIRGEGGRGYAIDMLTWKENCFEVIYCKPSFGGWGTEGLDIIDLDRDGQNEIVLAFRTGCSIYEWTRHEGNLKSYLNYDLTIKPSGYVYKRSKFDAGFKRKWRIKLPVFVHCSDPEFVKRYGDHIRNTYFYDQILTLGKIDGQRVLARIGVHPGGADKQLGGWEESRAADIGKLRIYKINPENIDPKHPKAKYLLPEEIGNIQLPTEPHVEPDTGNVYLKTASIKSIIIGDIDNDQKNEIVVNYKDGFYIIGMTAGGVLAFE